MGVKPKIATTVRCRCDKAKTNDLTTVPMMMAFCFAFLCAHAFVCVTSPIYSEKNGLEHYIAAGKYMREDQT